MATPDLITNKASKAFRRPIWSAHGRGKPVRPSRWTRSVRRSFILAADRDQLKLPGMQIGGLGGGGAMKVDSPLVRRWNLLKLVADESQQT